MNVLALFRTENGFSLTESNHFIRRSYIETAYILIKNVRRRHLCLIPY